MPADLPAPRPLADVRVRRVALHLRRSSRGPNGHGMTLLLLALSLYLLTRVALAFHHANRVLQEAHQLQRDTT